MDIEVYIRSASKIYLYIDKRAEQGKPILAVESSCSLLLLQLF